MSKHLIAPSFLSCDFGRTNEEVKYYNQSNADWYHLDVMDGRFVPNISFGFPIISSIKKLATKPLDVHLMIVEPEKYIAKLEFRHQLCSNFNAEIIYSQNMFFIFKGHLTKDLLQNYHESNKYPWLYKIDEKWYIYCTLTDE